MSATFDPASINVAFWITVVGLVSHAHGCHKGKGIGTTNVDPPIEILKRCAFSVVSVWTRRLLVARSPAKIRRHLILLSPEILYALRHL